MKKYLFLIAFLPLATTNGLHAQTINKTVDLSAGDTVDNVLNNSLKYAFKEFTDGTVIYKDGKAAGKLNYNYLNNEMQFIEPQTSRMQAVANVDNITMIIIDNRRFVPSGNKSEFIELITEGSNMLGVKRKINIKNYGTSGPYGSNSYSSLDGENNFMVNSSQTKTTSSSVKKIFDETLYYLVAGDEKNLIKGVKTFTKSYGKDNADKIKKYAEDNNINFNKEEDLIKMIQYCEAL